MTEPIQRQPQRGLTFDDVWAAMMETDRKFQETDRQFKESQKETDRQFKESQKETDRQFKELFEAQKETDRQFKETDRQFKETDRQFKKTEQLVKNNARQIKALNEQMGGLHMSFGELAEHLVAPGIAKKFNDMGYYFDDVSPGGRQILDGHGKVLTEIDLLLENMRYSIAVEVKTRPKESDIEHHLKRLELLRKHMDKYNDKRIVIGAIAGAVFPVLVREAAIAAGLYVLVQSGDTMKIEIPEGFQPREWASREAASDDTAVTV
ncbi:MAG: hypothetical protein LBJ41_10325 [Treponema sp.]|jgi:hypothetical protein|nr:hypothetical protein [Treponema sp.]